MYHLDVFLRRIVKFKYKNDTKTTNNKLQNMHKVTKCYNSHTILNKSHQKWLIFRFFPSFSIFSYIFVCFCHFFYTFANVKRAQRQTNAKSNREYVFFLHIFRKRKKEIKI